MKIGTLDLKSDQGNKRTRKRLSCFVLVLYTQSIGRASPTIAVCYRKVSEWFVAAVRCGAGQVGSGSGSGDRGTTRLRVNGLVQAMERQTTVD